MNSQSLRRSLVFTFPSSLTFYVDDNSTHKQVLTLYNPYEFPIKFRMLCTAPQKYSIVDPEGTVKEQCCVDIVVRHKEPTLANCTKDKFRIQIVEYPTKQLIGKRDIEATLVEGVPESVERITPDPDLFQQLPSTGRTQQSYTFINQKNPPNRDYLALAAIIFSLVGLFLPMKGEDTNSIFEFFSLTVNAKLSCAFVLGAAITWLFLRHE